MIQVAQVVQVVQGRSPSHWVRGVGKSGEPQVMVIFSGKNDMRTSFSWENDRKPWDEDSNDPIFRQRPARFANFCSRIGTK